MPSRHCVGHPVFVFIPVSDASPWCAGCLSLNMVQVWAVHVSGCSSCCDCLRPQRPSGELQCGQWKKSHSILNIYPKWHLSACCTLASLTFHRKPAGLKLKDFQSSICYSSVRNTLSAGLSPPPTLYLLQHCLSTLYLLQHCSWADNVCLLKSAKLKV